MFVVVDDGDKAFRCFLCFLIKDESFITKVTSNTYIHNSMYMLYQISGSYYFM